MRKDQPGVLILNDTSSNNHHGCVRVMQTISAGLEGEGLSVIGRVPVGASWKDHPGIEALLAEAQGIVINGEGTLHHGAAKGEELLQIATHPLRGGKPLFLINALYQENPPDWLPFLQAFTGIWTRDARSAAAISLGLGRTISNGGDLSLTVPFTPTTTSRKGTLIGDSVLKPARELILSVADARLGDKRLGIKWYPVSHRRALARKMHAAAHVFPGGPALVPGLPPRIVKTPEAYCAALARAELHLTGRFHGVCLSIATRTPFLTLASNAWKIEALIEEAGLNPDRLCTEATLQSRLRAEEFRRFSDAEARNMEAFLKEAASASVAMFQEIGAAILARPDAQSGRSAVGPKP